MNVRMNCHFYGKMFCLILFVVVLEIEERKQFLDQMAAIGKRKDYQQVISNEIAEV